MSIAIVAVIVMIEVQKSHDRTSGNENLGHNSQCFRHVVDTVSTECIWIDFPAYFRFAEAVGIVIISGSEEVNVSNPRQSIILVAILRIQVFRTIGTGMIFVGFTVVLVVVIPDSVRPSYTDEVLYVHVCY